MSSPRGSLGAAARSLNAAVSARSRAVRAWYGARPLHLLALLLLLVWFPLILGLSATTYQRASGLVTDPYLWRWLAVTGVMFALSAVSYALARRRASARARRGRHGRYRKRRQNP